MFLSQTAVYDTADLSVAEDKYTVAELKEHIQVFAGVNNCNAVFLLLIDQIVNSI